MGLAFDAGARQRKEDLQQGNTGNQLEELQGANGSRNGEQLRLLGMESRSASSSKVYIAESINDLVKQN